MTQCRNRCGVDVMHEDQHLVTGPDGSDWICSEPKQDVLFGRDKPQPMDKETRKAIERDKFVTGRGFARIIDGKLQHIPADQVVVFSGDPDVELLGPDLAKLWDDFNRHTFNSGKPVSYMGVSAVDLATELAKILDMPKDQPVTIDGILAAARALMATPTPMWLTCPRCNAHHIDEGAFKTKPHHTHSCQVCGLTWRPAVSTTVGVQYLPGFKNQ